MTHQRDMSEVLEAREQLELLFKDIPPEHLRVFTEKVLGDLTISAVAEQLDMNANTARTYWLRALATLQAKARNLENRGIRGFLIVVGVSSILAVANNASAMVEWILKLFRPATHMPLRGLPGIATAALVVLSPPAPGASADSVEQSTSTPTANVSVQSEAVATPVVIEKLAETTFLVSEPIPQKTVPRKPLKNVAPPDHLLAMALTAQRYGQPEKAIELLEHYPIHAAKQSDMQTVRMLRADAKKAIEAKLRSPSK